MIFAVEWFDVQWFSMLNDSTLNDSTFRDSTIKDSTFNDSLLNDLTLSNCIFWNWIYPIIVLSLEKVAPERYQGNQGCLDSSQGPPPRLDPLAGQTRMVAVAIRTSSSWQGREAPIRWGGNLAQDKHRKPSLSQLMVWILEKNYY